MAWRHSEERPMKPILAYVRDTSQLTLGPRRVVVGPELVPLNDREVLNAGRKSWE
jgi:hypothetical protein